MTTVNTLTQIKALDGGKLGLHGIGCMMVDKVELVKLKGGCAGAKAPFGDHVATLAFKEELNVDKVLICNPLKRRKLTFIFRAEILNDSLFSGF